MYYVLIGYGCDVFGEDVLFGYIYSQYGGMGVSFIVFMGNCQIVKEVLKEVWVKEVLVEGCCNGKVVKCIIE